MSSSQSRARTSCVGHAAAIVLACFVGGGCADPASPPVVDFTAGPASDPIPTVSAPTEGPPSDAAETSTSTPIADPAMQDVPMSAAASGPGAAHNPKAADTASTAGSGSSATDMTSAAGSGAGGSGADMPAGAAGSAAPVASAATALSVTLTTVTQGGKYAPLNVGAIWIETTAGQWIDTLEYWDSRVNAHWLSRYSKAGGPAYDGFFTTAPPDVISSATLKMHKTHSSTWDLKDSTGKPVPAGTYRVAVELTEYNGTGKSAQFEFRIGSEPGVIPTTDDSYYKSVALELK